ncbi:MAG: magnesium transporter [Fibrobacterota bacterium]
MVAEELNELIETRAWGVLRKRLKECSVPELVDIALDAPKEHRMFIFRSLPRTLSAEVFANLEPDQQDDLVRELTSYEMRQLLANLDPDDRTALLEELPAEMTRKLLSLLDDGDLVEARQLLGYPDESAGRLMTPDYVSVRPEWTIREGLDHIRRQGVDSETINMVYVTDRSGKLLDDFKLRKLILADPNTKIADIMDHNFASLSAFDDREVAVSLMQRYDLAALPVVDSNGDLLGIVTFDDVMDVAEEEATEDIQKGASVTPLKMSYRGASILDLYLKRIGWLVTLVLLNLASAGVIAAYEESLSQAVVLLFFIPLLIASGGNTGAQSSTLIIRALTTGDIRMNQWARTFGKEIFVGLLLGLSLGILGGALGYIRGDFRVDIMLAIAFSMSSIVVVGNTIGMILPFLLAKLNLDPATASGPLITTLADTGGLLIYFSIATALIN